MTAEILSGELAVSPRPANPHAFSTTSLGDGLAPIKAKRRRGDGGGGRWWVFDKPELHLVADVMVPDLEAWRVSTLAVPPHAPHFETPPDWVCEVLSPRSAARDRLQRLTHYARRGIDWAWTSILSRIRSRYSGAESRPGSFSEARPKTPSPATKPDAP